MDNETPDFYLTSSEYYSLRQPRECYRIKRIHYGSRDDCLLIRINPPIYNDFSGEPPIIELIIATRIKGETLFPVSKLPIEVYVLRFSGEEPKERDKLEDGELTMIGWAELYARRP